MRKVLHIILMFSALLYLNCTSRPQQPKAAIQKTTGQDSLSMNLSNKASIDTSAPRNKILRKLHNPLTVAGMLVSHIKYTTDNATKLYGEGYYTSDEGHGGGVYFTNPYKTVTLHYTIGVDHMIEEVELTFGLDLPEDLNATKQLPKKIFSNNVSDTLSIDGIITLGCDSLFLKSVLGKPTTVEKTEDSIIYKYQDSDSEYGFYEGTYYFRNNKLIKFSVYCGC